MAQAPPTPPFVVNNGWRDSEYVGEDCCSKCHGWGTLKVQVKADERQVTMHRTCPSCAGTGHD
jgi:DnaJ-class molecular chaperone